MPRDLGLISICKYLKRGRKKSVQALSSSAQWQNRRQWPQTETHNVHSEYQKIAFLLWEWPSTGTGCSERWCSIRPWRHSVASWMWSWAAGCRRPHLSTGIDQMTSRAAFQPHLFYDSSWFCEMCFIFCLKIISDSFKVAALYCQESR